MLTSIGKLAVGWTQSEPLWGSGYALARTLLALATALTLLATPTTSLFLPTADRVDYPVCQDVSGAGLFCLLSDHLQLARWIAITSMTPVVLGLWPRIFGLVHWWISFSLQANATMVDGGDQIAAILAMFLLPCTLADPRWNHWAPIGDTTSGPGLHARLFSMSGLLAIRVQVAIIYFHAFVSKCRVSEWINGTALYYWLLDPQFGASGFRRTLIEPLAQSSPVALLTWCTLAIEGALFLAIVAPARVRRLLVLPGLFLHIAIAVVHGLVSFSLVMSAALVLYAGWEPRRSILRVHARQPVETAATAPIA